LQCDDRSGDCDEMSAAFRMIAIGRNSESREKDRNGEPSKRGDWIRPVSSQKRDGCSEEEQCCDGAASNDERSIRQRPKLNLAQS